MREVSLSETEFCFRCSSSRKTAHDLSLRHVGNTGHHWPEKKYNKLELYVRMCLHCGVVCLPRRYLFVRLNVPLFSVLPIRYRRSGVFDFRKRDCMSLAKSSSSQTRSVCADAYYFFKNKTTWGVFFPRNLSILYCTFSLYFN